MGGYQFEPVQCQGNVLFISAGSTPRRAREELPERHMSAGGVGARAHAQTHKKALLEHTHILSSFEGNR